MIKAQCNGFLNTPPLWERKQFDIQQFEFPDLDLNSFNPEPIPDNIRLGHQIEQVCKQLIEHSEAYDVLLHNLPIRQEKRTLGEIDFMLKDKRRGKLIHVELTYKFYLVDPTISEATHQIIGPNKRDTFFLKMEKIKQQQIPLLHSVAGAKALADKGINHLAIEHQCCFKGQLFQPYGSSDVSVGALNKDCLVGYWLRLDDLNQSEFANAQYYMPTKSEWVIEPHNQVVWKSHAEIMVDIELRLLKESTPMIWVKKPSGGFEKCFVVWW